MSTQIAVRLPDDLMSYVDEAVRSGRAKDRASLVRSSLERMRREDEAAREIAIVTAHKGDPYPGLAGLAEHAARTPLDIE